MQSSHPIHRILLLLILCYQFSQSRCQFGIPKLNEGTADVGAGGTQNVGAGTLSEQDAVDMNELIQKASVDPKTKELIEKLKEDKTGELIEMKKLPPEELLGGMKQAMDEMKMLNFLFKDKQKAVNLMEKEGMIDPSRVKGYKENPSLLEEDTRRGLYFQFVSLAVVAGFFE